MSDDNKSKKWTTIVKIVAEFIVAVVTALFASSFVMYTDMKLPALRFFSEEEFIRCSPPCHLSDMSPVFMVHLDKARAAAGVPFVLNSAYRSREYELSRGRTGSSSHCEGIAVDISCTDSLTRQLIVSSLIRVGFDRIGIADRFIHVDADYLKSPAIWLYT